MSRASHSALFLRASERLSGELELVERAMREQLQAAHALIPAVGEHILGAGGKRLRPLLLFLAAELCGYSGPRRVQVAAALELLHNATLLHDDVVDLGVLRRGREAANALWGNRRAVLVGDFFYASASSMIVDDGDLEVLCVFSNCIKLMAEGEIIQLQRSFDSEVSETHYYDVISRKTASLLSAACELGAIMGGVTRAERRRLAEFGQELGLAFQLRDDALDYEADEQTLGKRTYTDLREGKITLPLLLTLKRATPAEQARISALLKEVAQSEAGGVARAGSAESEREAHRPTLAAAAQAGAVVDVCTIVELVRHYRGVEDTLCRAEEHAARAAACIAPFADAFAKQALLGAAVYAVERAT